MSDSSTSPPEMPPPDPHVRFAARTQSIATGHREYASPYRSSSQPSIYKQAARASWVAPLVAFTLAFTTSSFREHAENGAAFWIGAANALLIVMGFILGAASLFGMRKHGRSGILLPAMFGILINGVLLCFLLIGLLSGRERPSSNAASANSQTSMDRPLLTPQQIQDSIQNNPGWVGRAEIDRATIVLATVSGDSALGRDVKLDLHVDCLLMSVTIDPTGVEKPVMLDFSRAEVSVGHADHRIRACLSPSVVYNLTDSAKDQEFLASLNVIQIPVGQRSYLNTMIFLPNDIEPSEIESVTINANGAPIMIQGNYLSVDQKAANVRRFQNGEK